MGSLIDYAMRFIGIPYKWGGSNPIQGFDCSGFVQELLKSVGIDPPGDQTAQVLYTHFSDPANGQVVQPQPGALLFFGKSAFHVTHIAICLDSLRMIEAGGGGHLTVTREDAAAQNAFVRIRPIANRKDLVSVILPKYPSGVV